MAGGVHDPYEILGVSRSASDAELRAAYRRLVQLHHPDHNAGSPESARRFEEVQDAYAAVTDQRRTGASSATAPPRRRAASPQGGAAPPRGGAPSDPGLESRLADLERQLREANAARERAVRAAREAARESAATRAPRRASDEELGYVSTDDSFSKILSDAAAELSDRFSDAREHPVSKRVSDLIDELGSKLTGEPPKR
jgi:DnaJ-class molecular chaperone